MNNWSHQVGNHSIKFGVDLRYGLNHLTGWTTITCAPAPSFSRIHAPPASYGYFTGVGFATFLLGDPTAFQRTQTQNTDAQDRQNRFFLYGQDQWRATSRLTVNYGLRWELYFPETVNGKGQGGLLDLNTGNMHIAGYGEYRHEPERRE